MIKILIVEQSYLVRKGIMYILKQFPEVAEIEILGSSMGMEEVLGHFMPDILIVNSSLVSFTKEEQARLYENIKVLHLYNSIIPPDAPDNQISLYDSKVAIIRKLAPVIKAVGSATEVDGQEELTPREKLILTQVVLGLTNKEIANKLFISSHTVISHRKNITRKLEIKSVSGLTVYAIINGIVSMEDIS